MDNSHMQTSAAVSLTDWIVSHFHMLGWGFILATGVKFVRFLTKTEARFEKAEATLNAMANNHLTHIESSLQNVDGNLRGMREDMKGIREDLKDFSIAILKK